MFHIHPAIQTAKMKVLDTKFPGTQGFADGKLWTEEWYEFGPEKTTGLNYILGVDESTYNPKVDWGSRGKGIFSTCRVTFNLSVLQFLLQTLCRRRVQKIPRVTPLNTSRPVH